MTEETKPVSGAPIVRIIMRYIAGALVAVGAVSQETADVLMVDPDLMWMLGLAVGVVTETFYSWAKKRGWAT